jgi:hypothetical protein
MGIMGGAEPLRAVPTSTTSPHVEIVDLDFSFEQVWRNTIWGALITLASTLEGGTKGIYKADIDRGVKGWHASCFTGNDGYLLLRTRATRTRRTQGKPVLRITGVTGGNNKNLRPKAIECLLYEPELTEQVREMLANLARELGVTEGLIVYRQSDSSSWVRISSF